MADIRRPGKDPVAEDDRRSWEKYWDVTLRGDSFLRNDAQMNHPSRFFIADAAAKYGTVLECGCATAIDYPYHVERGTKYTGIDITVKWKAMAEKLYPDIDFRTASLLDLSLFPDRSVDTVYERAVFEHMHPLEWPLGAREMWRVADKQMLLAFFGRSIGAHPRRKPVLERMADENDKDTPERRVERSRAIPQAIVVKIYDADIVAVIESLPGEKTWKMDVVLGIPVEGRRPRGKPYYIYTVTRVD